MFTIPNFADAGVAAQAEPDSGDFAVLAAGLGRTGVVSGCVVTAQGSPNMTVAVAAGEIEIGSAPVSVTATNATITTADATHPRFDLVTVSLAGAVVVTAGTAAAAPRFPAIPASSVVLAAVHVPAGDTAVQSGQIVDKRAMLTLPAHRASALNYDQLSSPTTWRRRWWAAAENLNSTTFTQDAEHILFQSDEADYGGVDGLDAPGWISQINLMIDASSFSGLELPRLRVYYDGESTPTIDMPLECWTSSAYIANWRCSEMQTWCGGTYNLSWSFWIPIPWTSSVKVAVKMPVTAGGTWDAVYCYVDYFRGQHPQLTAANRMAKLRTCWLPLQNSSNINPNLYEIRPGQYVRLDFGPGTRLSSGIDSSTTSLPVTSPASGTYGQLQQQRFPSSGNYDIWVGSEKMTVTGGHHTATWTVTRGVDGTTAAAHSAGDPVIVDIGPGVIYGMTYHGRVAGVGSQPGWQEADIQVFTDGDTAAAYTAGSGGTEDFFGVGWYVGQGHKDGHWYVGTIGATTASESHFGFFRWFKRDPIYFDHGFHVVTGNGESGQASAHANSNLYGAIWYYTAS